ncbi:MAG TPA: hypothetical protein PLT36_06960 [Erysipelotrichaceae bacterium]|nr:hypothetical protein [Erysipelotrichaceae bacterium]
MEFGNKLTVIAGPSDTGKTCVYKCIDYIFGGNNDEDNLPFDENEGYTTVSLELETHKGTITLTRIQKESTTVVSSNIEGISSGEYGIKASKKNPNTMNELFLKLMDAPLDLKLPSNDKGKTAAFTWRTIKQAFIVDEGRADSKKSILLAQNNEPLYLASMIYMMTSNTLEEYKGDPKKELIKKTRKETLLNYIQGQRENLLKKKKDFEEKLKNLPEGKTLEDLVGELNNSIEELTKQIDDLSSQHQSLINELIPIRDRLTKNQTLITRYEKLSSQYATDINRLTFIVDNEDLIKNRTKKTKCPYCDSDIVPHNQESFIQASQAELVKAVTNSNELEETRVQIQDQIDDDQALINDYNERISQINLKIKNELIPQRKALTTKLQSYKDYMAIEGSLAYMDESDKELSDDYAKYEAEPDIAYTPFKGRPLFHNLLVNEIPTYAREILTEIGYAPINSVDFPKNNLDLLVNEKRKSARGKGYKAFTNTVLLLAFRKYLNTHSEKCFHFYMFDSPLKGLNLPEGQLLTENIRAGFFNYLVNNTFNDQVIIFENTDKSELPQIQINNDIKVYNFSGVENINRYGFLESVRRK